MIFVGDSSGCFGAGGIYERLRFERNAVGLYVSTSECGSTITFTECEFTEQVGDGVVFRGFSGNPKLRFVRTRIRWSGGRGMYFYAANEAMPRAIFEDSMIASSGLEGVFLEACCTAYANVSLIRCTIVDNAIAGIAGLGDDGYAHLASLTSSIVAANADDLVTDEHMQYMVEYSAIEDGDFAGANRNIGGDPGFVDRLAGDWRLAWGSPCIETGDPATPLGEPDLLGTLRAVDGDLDTIEAPDRGAMEFAPLVRLPPGTTDGYLRLELWGENGKTAVLWAAAGPLGAPQSTPFGEYDLAAGAFAFGTHPVASGPPGIVQKRLRISLLGRTYSFQAMTDSSAAPQRAAWTNPIEFTLGL